MDKIVDRNAETQENDEVDRVGDTVDPDDVDRNKSTQEDESPAIILHVHPVSAENSPILNGLKPPKLVSPLISLQINQPIIFGRGEGVALFLNDKTASRSHMELTAQLNLLTQLLEFKVKNLSKKTFSVNNVDLREHEERLLQSSDVIKIGLNAFTVELHPNNVTDNTKYLLEVRMVTAQNHVQIPNNAGVLPVIPSMYGHIAGNMQMMPNTNGMQSPASMHALPINHGHNQPGMAMSQPGMVMPLQGMAMSQQGMALPQQGMAMSQPGMVMPQQGMAMSQQGIAMSQYGMAMPQQGMAMPHQGFGMTQGMPVPQQQMAMSQQGMAMLNQGMAVQQQGFGFPHQGMQAQQGVNMPQPFVQQAMQVNPQHYPQQESMPASLQPQSHPQGTAQERREVFSQGQSIVPSENEEGLAGNSTTMSVEETSKQTNDCSFEETEPPLKD